MDEIASEERVIRTRENQSIVKTAVWQSVCFLVAASQRACVRILLDCCQPQRATTVLGFRPACQAVEGHPEATGVAAFGLLAALACPPILSRHYLVNRHISPTCASFICQSCFMHKTLLTSYRLLNPVLASATDCGSFGNPPDPHHGCRRSECLSALHLAPLLARLATAVAVLPGTWQPLLDT